MFWRSLRDLAEFDAGARKQRERECRARKDAEGKKERRAVIPESGIGKRGANHGRAGKKADRATGRYRVTIGHFAKEGTERMKGNLPNAIIDSVGHGDCFPLLTFGFY